MGDRSASAGPAFVILEDHTMVRQLLERRVRSVYPDATFVYQGPVLRHALDAMSTKAPSAILVDLDLGDDQSPEHNLTELLATGAPVLVISASASPNVVQRAISLGVAGYVSKQCDVAEFDRALVATVDGDNYISHDLARALTSAYPGVVELSPREERALTLYASGMKIEAVARAMGISRGTAAEYIKRVKKKYASQGEKVSTKVDLYRMAKQEGLL